MKKIYIFAVLLLAAVSVFSTVFLMPGSVSASEEVPVVKEKRLTAEGVSSGSSDSLIAIFNRALTAFDSAKYNVAINTWYGILDGFKSEGDIENYVIAASNIGIAFNNMKKHGIALDWALHALEVAKAEKLYSYAESYYESLISKYEGFYLGVAATKHAQEAVDFFKSAGKGDIANTYLERLDGLKANVAEVEARLKTNESLATTEKNPGSLAKIHVSLGEYYKFLGQFDKARDHSIQGLKFSISAGLDSLASLALSDLSYLDMMAKHLRDDKYAGLWKTDGGREMIKVFSIEEVKYITPDSVVVRVHGGAFDNIVPGAEVNLWAGVYPELPEHDVYHLARGKVIETGNYSAYVGARLFYPENPQKHVLIVDHAYIPVTVPAGYTSPLLDVAKSDINFRKYDNETIYTFNMLSKLADPAIDGKILQILLDDYKSLYTLIDGIAKDDPVSYGPAKSGSFKGLALNEAIRKSNLQNAEEFLMFVKDFPAKYLGLSFQFIESYFSWVSGEAIAGQTKLGKAVLNAKDEKDLRRIFEIDSVSISDYDITGKFADSSDELYPIGELEKSNKFSLAAATFADWLLNTEKIKRAWLSRGLYLKQIEDFPGTEYAYHRSLEHARKLDDSAYVSSNQHNLGILYSDMEQYEKSIAYYDTCLAYRLAMVKRDPSDWMWERIGGSYWGKAYSLAGMDKYKESVEFYELALAAYDSSKSNSSSGDKLTVLRNIADVYSKMGDYQRAFEIYQRVYDLAIANLNKSREAQALYDMAYMLFELSDYVRAIDFYEKSYNKYLEMEDYDNAGLCQSNIAQAEWNLGNFQKAIACHNKSIEYREKTGNKADQAFSYDKLGSLYSKQGDPEKALEYFNKALELYGAQNDNVGMAGVYDNIGAMYKKLNDYERTFEYFKKSLEIKEKAKDKYAIAENYYEQGMAYMTFNDIANATAMLNKALELNLLVNDRLDAIYCMLNLGQIQYGFRNNFDSALVIFQRSIEMAKEIKNNAPIAFAFKQMGMLYSEKGESVTSIKYLDSALAVYELMQEKAEIGNVYLNLGSASISGGEFDKAMSYFLKAENVAKSMNNINLIADVYIYKGDLYRIQGEYAKAKETFDSAYIFYRKIENPWAIANLSISYGNIYNVQGEYQLSIDNYKKADSIYAFMKNDYYRSTPLNNIGTVYFWQGDYEAALPYFTKALSILDSIKYHGDFRTTVLSNIGEVLYEQDKFAEAEKYMLMAVEHAKRNNAKAYLPTPYGLLASINIDTKKYDEAEKWAKMAYDLSVELKDRSDILSSSLVLGRLNHIKNNIPVSNQFLNKSIELSLELGTNKLIYHSYYFKALNFQTEKQQDSSITYLKKAVTVLNDIRGKLVGGDKAAKLFQSGEMKVRIYEALINAFIQKGQLDSALFYLDMSYNEGLKEQFGNVTPKFEDKAQNEAIEKEKELKNKKAGLEEQLEKEKSKPVELQNSEKIASLQASLEVAENSYVEFIMETVQKNPGLDDYFKDNINPVSFLEWQEFIPDDVAVLAYLMGDNNLYIFGATSDSVGAVVMNIKKEELEQKLVEFYSMLKDSYPPKEIGEVDINTYAPKDPSKSMEDEMYLAPQRKLGMELYQLLVAPVKNIFKDKKKLCVVPFGKLYYLPFETLISSKPGENIKFLLEDHLLFYVTSFKVFSQNTAKEPVPMRLIAFANADKSLPSAEVEVTKLKNLFEDAEIYSRDDATEEKIRSLSKGQFNALHLATHGNMNYGEITKSFLTMAPKGAGADTKNDGQLTINEVWGLTNLRNYKLVTLSACKTAISEEFAKGWLVSPANAFLKVGVQTVVASLWQVEDEATSILMSEFYSNLRSMSKSEALQQAKLKLIKNPKYAFPYFWAPFIMVGDYR